MNSYSYSHSFNISCPSIPYIYPNFNTHSTTYCTCCSSPSSFYQQSMPMSPPPPSPYFSYNNQIPTATITAQCMQQQSSTSKTTRLQYSNKDRYILNELFKRTPYPNAIQRDLISRKLGITSEQIRIWFQNRRRLQTQRDAGERLATANELIALQLGKTKASSNELKTLFNEISRFKNASPRIRLDELS